MSFIVLLLYCYNWGRAGHWSRFLSPVLEFCVHPLSTASWWTEAFLCLLELGLAMWSALANGILVDLTQTWVWKVLLSLTRPFVHWSYKECVSGSHWYKEDERHKEEPYLNLGAKPRLAKHLSPHRCMNEKYMIMYAGCWVCTWFVTQHYGRIANLYNYPSLVHYIISLLQMPHNWSCCHQSDLALTSSLWSSQNLLSKRHTQSHHSLLYSLHFPTAVTPAPLSFSTWSLSVSELILATHPSSLPLTTLPPYPSCHHQVLQCVKLFWIFLF